MIEDKNIKKQILNLVREYSIKKFESTKHFYPGKSHIPVSGKLIGHEEIQLSVDSCLDGWFTTGRFSKEFELKFAKYMNQRFCLLTNSGSSANLLTVSALTSPLLKEKKLNRGDEVITVAAGFPTTVNPIIQNGLVPVFVDVNLEDFGIDTSQLEKALSKKTKAIILAHTLGNPFNVQFVANFAKKHNLWLIEDCCDAVGSTYNGKMVGTYGDLATVSFYPAHHITMGEGGAVLTNNPKLKKIVESFRDWGRDCWCEPGIDNTCGKRFDWQLGDLPYGYDHKYIYSHVGYNLKLTDMQAAIGLAQLKKLKDFIKIRKQNFDFFYQNLKILEKHIFLPTQSQMSESSWFGFPIRIKRECPIQMHELVSKLNQLNIGTRYLFGGNLTKQPLYKQSKYKQVGNLKNTDLIMKSVFWIGVQPNLTLEEKQFVVDSLIRLINNN